LDRARVLLADDNPSFGAEIRGLLEAEFDVVGLVETGEALEAAFAALLPQVVVTDIAMPGEGGLVAVRRIRERFPGTPAVLLTVIDAPLMIRLSLSSGAMGYVVKEDAGEELIPAVEAVLLGQEYLSAAARRSLG
jgi:DNA-binding NarL/FixJ family response regulator